MNKFFLKSFYYCFVCPGSKLKGWLEMPGIEPDAITREPQQKLTWENLTLPPEGHEEARHLSPPLNETVKI